MELHV